jgi:hypothetical protein
MRVISKVKTNYIHSGINEYGYSKYFIRFTDDDEEYQVQLNDDEKNNEQLAVSKIINFLNQQSKQYLSIGELENFDTIEWIEEDVITDERIRAVNESPV